MGNTGYSKSSYGSGAPVDPTLFQPLLWGPLSWHPGLGNSHIWGGSHIANEACAGFTVRARAE